MKRVPHCINKRKAVSDRMVSHQNESGISRARNQNGANERCSTWVERRRQLLCNFGFPAKLRLILHNPQRNRCGVRLTKQRDRTWLSIDADQQDWVPSLEAIECSPPIAGTRLSGNQRRHGKGNEAMRINQPKQVLKL